MRAPRRTAHAAVTAIGMPLARIGSWYEGTDQPSIR